MESYEDRRNKVDFFLINKGKYFLPESIPYIQEKLMNMPDNKFMLINALEFKDPTVMLVISIIGGCIGVDRFLLGEIGLGVLKFITAGGCGLWTIIDWFLIMNKTREYNFNKLNSVLY